VSRSTPAVSNAPWRAKKNDSRRRRASTGGGLVIRDSTERCPPRRRQTRWPRCRHLPRHATGARLADVGAASSDALSTAYGLCPERPRRSRTRPFTCQHGSADTLGGEACPLTHIKKSAPIICGAMHSCMFASLLFDRCSRTRRVASVSTHCEIERSRWVGRSTASTRSIQIRASLAPMPRTATASNTLSLR